MNVDLVKHLQLQHSDSYRKHLEKTEHAPAGAAKPAPDKGASAPQGDRINLSSDARLHTQAFSAAMAAPDVRQERVDALKAQVEDGSYVVDSKRIAQKLLQEEQDLFGA
jgi:negative regulator of flagellin synthesis FlgM